MIISPRKTQKMPNIPGTESSSITNSHESTPGNPTTFIKGKRDQSEIH